MGTGEVICLSLHCHHQNDSCIKMGSEESNFNVSLFVRDKVTRQCPRTTTFEEKGEPERMCPKLFRTAVLKEKGAGYTSCFAMATSPPPYNLLCWW